MLKILIATSAIGSEKPKSYTRTKDNFGNVRLGDFDAFEDVLISADFSVFRFV